MAEKTKEVKKKVRIIINSTHYKLKDQWRTAKDPDLVWAQHINNREELEQYALALIHREAHVKAQQRVTTTEWCYQELQKYFCGGRKEKRRDVELRRVALHSPHLLSTHCISNSDAVAMQSREPLDAVTEKPMRTETVPIEKVSVGEDRSAQPMQRGRKRMEKRILTNVDSGSLTESATDRILAEEPLAKNMKDFVDSEMISISKDVARGGTDQGTFKTRDDSLASDSRRLRVLDVGSCYNPFKVYADLDVVALDLLPATKDTYQCDFLKLTITEPSEAISETASCLPGVESLNVPGEGAAPAAKGSPSSRKILSLPSNSFDAVIFSSLLSYLPCPELRLLCCKQAYRLIKPEGVLVVAELDPRSSIRYGYFFKTWYIALSSLGFSRVKYQKTRDFYGMLFRKDKYPEAHQLRSKFILDKMNLRKKNIVSQNPKSEALVRRRQQIKDFDLDKALTGLWHRLDIADVRHEQVTPTRTKPKSVKTPACSSKPSVDSQVKQKLPLSLGLYLDAIKIWIRKIMVTKMDS